MKVSKKVMIDVIAFIVVSWTPIASCIALIQTMRCADLIDQCNAYEHVLDRVYEDNPDYYLDVLSESDEYAELQHQLGKE